MLNVVAIMGRLVADPELRTTPQGTNVCSFRIACDRNFVRQGEQRQADFIDIVAWRSQAEFVSKYFQKGSLIAIEGSLQTRQYQDKNGNNRTAVEVVANNISFAGPKSSNQGGGANYQNSAPAYQNAAPARPAACSRAGTRGRGPARARRAKAPPRPRRTGRRWDRRAPSRRGRWHHRSHGRNRARQTRRTGRRVSNPRTASGPLPPGK